MRVLLRLGYGAHEKSYARSYRSAQEPAARELPRDMAALIRAHRLLRRHGQEICKTNHPRCEACPVRAECAYYAALRTTKAPGSSGRSPD